MRLTEHNEQIVEIVKENEKRENVVMLVVLFLTGIVTIGFIWTMIMVVGS